MTTDLIKTLEELQSIRGYWFPEHSKAYVDSLPQVIDALKRGDRMRVTLKELDVHSIRLETFADNHFDRIKNVKLIQSIIKSALATADTKENES